MLCLELFWSDFKPINQLAQSLSPLFNLLGISPQIDNTALRFEFFGSRFKISLTIDEWFSIYCTSPGRLRLAMTPEKAFDLVKQIFIEIISEDPDVMSSYLNNEFVVINDKPPEENNGLADLVCQIVNQQTDLLFEE